MVEAYAITSKPAPMLDQQNEVAPGVLLHAVAMSYDEAKIEVLRMRREVFQTLHMIGSLPEKLVDQWMEYRASIGITAVTIGGLSDG